MRNQVFIFWFCWVSGILSAAPAQARSEPAGTHPSAGLSLRSTSEGLKKFLSGVGRSATSVDDSDGLDIIVDGEDLKLLIEAYTESLPTPDGVPQDEVAEGQLLKHKIMDATFGHMIRARFKSDGQALQVALLFDQAFEIPIFETDKVKSGQLYALKVPRFVRYQLSFSNDRLFLAPISSDMGIQFFVKLPLLPDGVVLRSAILDGITGNFYIVAGILGNHLAIHMTGSVFKRSHHFEFWSTLFSNWRVFLFCLWDWI